MRYEKYQKRITKIADVLRVILRKWQLLLLLFIIFATAISVFIVVKGTVISVECAPTVFYGDEIDCKAIAFLSKTQLEYRAESGEWTLEAPVMPGEYQLRVVADGFFGKKTSNSISFTIEKRKISVHSLNGTIDYGEKPVLSADLAYEDFLSCEEFEIGDIFMKDGISGLYVSVMPDNDSVVIKNADGQDVTGAYEISVEREDLRIIPRNITVTVEDATKTYDGKHFSFDGYELSNGSLSNGDSLFAYFTKSIVDVGSIENTPELVLISANGTDVTPCYNITVIKGMLTVEKRPLVLTTESGEFDYDGTAHVLDGYEMSADTPLVEGQSLSVLWGGITDAGNHKNIPASVTVTAENEVDVTNNYSIFFEAGTLTVNPLPITIATANKTVNYCGREYQFSSFGFQIEQGSLLDQHDAFASKSSSAINVGQYENDTTVTILDINTFKDVTHNYDITYICGSFEIEKLPIVIETLSCEWTYDGTSHYSEDFMFASIGYNDKIIVTGRTTVVDVGKYTNKLSVKIVKEDSGEDGSSGGTQNSGIDSYDNIDVSHNYDISYIYGTLTVTKRLVTLKPDDAKKIYDATPLMSSVVQESPQSENKLVYGHTVFSAQTSGTITDVGTVTNYIIPSTVVIHNTDGNDVTRNYEFLFSVGLLTVTPREILVQTGGAVKTYDGTALTNDSFTVAANAPNVLVEGHVLSVENIGSLSRVGKTENICRLDKTRIYDAYGKDVTKNYLIKYSYGILEVFGEPDGDLYGNGFNGSGTIGSFKSDLTPPKDGTAILLPSLLSVKDERNGYIYLRLKSFGGYTGSEWNEATEYSELLLGKYSANYLASLALGYNTRELTVNAKNPYFFMPYYTSIQDMERDIGQTSDVIYTNTAGLSPETLYTVFYKDYDYHSTLILPEEYAEFEEAYRAFVYSQYLIVDDETRAYMEDIIESQKFLGTDMETILKVAKYVQNCAVCKTDYNEALDSEANIAIAFLDLYGEGISQHFATALTLLYRTMGIPARYTVGYATSTLEDEWVEVDRSKVHAWVEVYVDGVGWIEIEATGGSNFGLNGSGGKPQKQTITVKPAYQCKKADGKALNATTLIEYDELLAELYAKGYSWSVEVSGSIHTVGRGESIPASFILYDPYGKNVTDQYNIVYENGILEIFESDAILIEIGLGRLQKYYDGTPLSFTKSDYEIVKNSSFLRFELDVDISLTEVGYLTLSDLNENPEKYVTVTYNPTNGGTYPDQRVVVIFVDHPTHIPSVALAEPVIQVDRTPITVTASSASKIFDGTPLTSDMAYLTKGALCEGHTLTVTVSGSIDYPGTTVNEIMRVIITNELGEDVTGNYDVTKVNGTLTVYQ